ncbi:MAG: purine-nucleoside phosphorylase [Edaphobacter sp.]
MTDQYTRATAAVAHIHTLTPLMPRLGIILGSGLGNFASHVEHPITIAYADIPHFPPSTVEGHSGKLLLGTINKIPVAVMQGRVHSYEGYSLSEVTFPTRVLGLLGCKSLIITNAAGGINTSYKPGSLVVISDHINFTGSNAALGPNEGNFGPRFFDMGAAYSPQLRALAQAEAARQNIALAEGIYLAVVGPSYETPAEIRAFRALGADLVGMSTVHEVIIARHMDIEVLGLSLVTNMAAGVLDEAINHEEVMQSGLRVERPFTDLLTALIPQISAAK